VVFAEPVNNQEIGFCNAAFSWSSNPNSSAPSQRHFRLNFGGKRVVFMRGHINLIVGPTGSGKTSLLMALLGMVYFALLLMEL
jgi:ABC-type multidrug transport system fused ATPase/permease subunit